MRTLSPALLLVLALLPSRASAGTITVTPSSQTVETSRFAITWNLTWPDIVQAVVFKDWSPSTSVCATGFTSEEFWGQSARNLNAHGYVRTDVPSTHTWQVTAQTPSFAQITLTWKSQGEPDVTTVYTFLADQPYFQVERTIRFSTQADTAAYQAYLSRMAFLADYRAVRWRDTAGAIVQRGFCIAPCLSYGWDGHWVQLLLRQPGGKDLGISTLYRPGDATGLALVRGTGPLTPSGWTQPRLPAGVHATDRTWRELHAFSIAPDDIASLDALWTAFANGSALAGVPGPGVAPAAPRLTVSPNPALGPATLAWSHAVAGEVTLDVLDVSGRRVARLASGTWPAGEQRITWNGLASSGARVAPGLYLARLVTAGGAVTTTFVRAN